MSNREDLDRLIESALADSKLTSKEMEVLVKKAKQLGTDEDEFLILLDAKKYKARHIKDEKPKISKGKFVIAGIALFIIVTLVISFKYSRSVNKGKELSGNQLEELPKKEQMGVTEKFDIALSKFDFDSAYSLINQYPLSNDWSRIQRLTTVAVTYYLKNNQPQLAIDALKEYPFVDEKPRPRKPDDEWYWQYQDEIKWHNGEVQFINSLWFDVAYYLVKNGKINEGKDIVNLKLIPFLDDIGNSTFKPIQEKKESFQSLINDIRKR
jgi:hypothetical protein